MTNFGRLSTRALRLLPPESAHIVTVRALAAGLGPSACARPDPSLRCTVAGLDFPNPIGMAAGFDKNAEAPDASLKLGFGFVEVGAVTPRPQRGNPRPRVFRLPANEAVINRYGFNNDGLDRIADRLRRRRARPGVVGANLGANKDSADRAADYVTGLSGLAGLVDFFTVNVSSPNTPGLRALQDKAALGALLADVCAARDRDAPGAPVFLKIAPDLTDEDAADVAAVVTGSAVNGLIVSNTTIERPSSLSGPFVSEKGGLSGRPLFDKSTRLLEDMARATNCAKPLIGVGGVSSARDAYAKILVGASLVQLYTALVFRGPGLVAEIVRELPQLMKADGFDSVSDAVGARL
ncbi:MAG: quinone-dependent dihydroorotate dehydrogenase [Alphaproteobacteria bacterium]|nr:quinone-dependent dihydroorotate dehydrogenase [Alphaproteobacteria bacterium]